MPQYDPPAEESGLPADPEPPNAAGRPGGADDGAEAAHHGNAGWADQVNAAPAGAASPADGSGVPDPEALLAAGGQVGDTGEVFPPPPYAAALLVDDPPKIGDFWLDARLSARASGVTYLAHASGGEPVMLILLSDGAAGDAAARDRLAAEVNKMHIDTVVARGGAGQDDGRLASKFRTTDPEPIGPNDAPLAPWVALAYDGSTDAVAEADRVLRSVDLSSTPNLGRASGPDYQLPWIARIRPGNWRNWPLPWPGRANRAGWLSTFVAWLLMLVLAALALLIIILVFQNVPPPSPQPPVPTSQGSGASGDPSGSPTEQPSESSSGDSGSPSESSSGDQGQSESPSESSSGHASPSKEPSMHQSGTGSTGPGTPTRNTNL